MRRATPSDLPHGKAALTPEIALRIEKAFGPDMNHLLRMQPARDVAKTREHARDSLARSLPKCRYWSAARNSPVSRSTFHRARSELNCAS